MPATSAPIRTGQWLGSYTGERWQLGERLSTIRLNVVPSFSVSNDLGRYHPLKTTSV